MTSLKGRLLVASPRLLDPNFVRTVLLMLDHTDEGAAALVLNRPTDRTIAEIAEDVFEEPLDWDKTIHLGGPVPGPVIVVHGEEDAGDQMIVPGVFTTVDSTRLLDLLRRKVEPSLVLANYAGWGPGQLEREMGEDSWETWPATASHVFWEGQLELWEAVTREIRHDSLSSIIHLDTRPIDPGRN